MFFYYLVYFYLFLSVYFYWGIFNFSFPLRVSRLFRCVTCTQGHLRTITTRTFFLRELWVPLGPWGPLGLMAHVCFHVISRVQGPLESGV